MLDPEILDKLAATPEHNAPRVNVALAEEGPGSVLVLLARSRAVLGDALAIVGQRLMREGASLEPAHDDELDDPAPSLIDELERLLIAHPNAPANVRDAILGRKVDDAFFVLAACAHPSATPYAVERAALWPCRFPVFDRPWMALVGKGALSPLTVEEWAQDSDCLKREAAATIADDEQLLARLAHDASRQIRRAVASNPNAGGIRIQLASSDPAVEVRARAARAPGQDDPGPPSVSTARFAAALRAMQAGGSLAPDVASALSEVEALDDEGAALAARVLPPAQVVGLIRRVCRPPGLVVPLVGLAAGLAVRKPEDSGGDDGLRELVAEVVKALSGAADRFGSLTGKARLAAWLGEGLAKSHALEATWLVRELLCGVIGGEGPVLARGAAMGPELLPALCASAARVDAVPPALFELAWHDARVDDASVLAMSRRIAPCKRRGHDLPDDEVDLDPRARDIGVLEAAVLAASRQVTVSPRAALAVAALDARRVRYVLTALPQWRGRLRGSMLGRVLKQNAGALSAARSESRPRSAEIRTWTERVLNDIEMAVALGLGHYTAEGLVERIRLGRHRIEDGVSLAAGAEARATLEGADAVRPLLGWATGKRSDDGTALALWLLLEGCDRSRPAGMIAASIDSLAARQSLVSESVTEALALLERRKPGRLETVVPNTPRGKATLAAAIARAYRAVGGLRDER